MNEGKKMSHDEMMRFIESIGRMELFEELKGLQSRQHRRGATEYKGSYYLKAVRVTLHSLGYDCQWVDGEFRDALEDYYDGLVEKEMMSDAHR